MSLDTGRYAQASAVVCGHQGADLGALTDAQLVQMQRDFGAARQALDVLQAELSGHVATRAQASPGPGGIARRAGFKSPKHMIAETLGTTGGEAQRLLDAGKVLSRPDAGASPAPRFPLASAALRGGQITVEKFTVIASAMERLRVGEAAERQFVELARRLKIWDLKRVCEREVLMGDPDSLEARDRRLHELRTLNLCDLADGMTRVEGLLDPASAAHLRAWLEKQVKAAFQAKRETPGDERTAEQIRVDALAMLAHHAMDCDSPGTGVKTTLIVRVNLEDLERRVGAATCDSVGTVFSVKTALAMAVDLQVVPMVMGGGSVPLDVGYAKRLATPYQKLALLERDGGCAWCHAPGSYCDAHHITGWQQRGPTNLDNLVMLCVSCHHQLHFGGWLIEVEQGVVWFTPPPEVDPQQVRRKGGLADLRLAA